MIGDGWDEKEPRSGCATEKGSKGRGKKIKLRVVVTMAYSRKGARGEEKKGKSFMLFLLNDKSSGNFNNITLSQKNLRNCQK